jgi:MarR family transcriptional regulator, organic hydroperoxide resistance regulator
MKFKQLKLENQLCFPVYAASRLIIREYQPYLEKLGITYPQYLVLLVLWEKGRVSVNGISQKLILNTNTVTPLLKRMESQGFIKRNRSESDERKVMVALTRKGKQLQAEAASIPAHLASALISEAMQIEDLGDLKEKLQILVGYLMDKKPAEVRTKR